MYNRKIISCRNERKIYHNPCCMYVKRMLSENAMDISKAEAEKHGYQACKYCNSMNSHYHSSEKSLSHYTETRGMELKRKDGMLFVKTEISCWKLVYSKQWQNFVLYHRNQTDRPLDFRHPEAEQYHRQTDAGTSISIMEFLKYIYAHDRFRQNERNGIRALPTDNRKQNEYARKAKKKNTYQSINRVESLFTVLESQNKGYLELSFC